ncbi:ATP-binding cassette sub-family C member 4-like [Euwallacea fornicatus]|uniref:ATP-binding cassette sub-family C member 4-like n=1 Tax=Euwallacea fornicatus TaxID=995702 RepID=UPI00338F796A
MEAPFKLKLENPAKKANCFSKIFFVWVIPLFYTGTKRLLTLTDLYKPLDRDKSKYLAEKLHRAWSDEMEKARVKNYKPKLIKAIIKAFWNQYYLYGVYLFMVIICFRTPQPLLLSWMISQFGDSKINDKTAMYSSATALVLLSFGAVVLQHQGIIGSLCSGMRLRVAVSSLVNRKILKLSKRSMGQTAAGQIINILSNDCQRFDSSAFYLHYLWIMPFQIAVTTYLLWKILGIACIVGLGCMIFCTIPFQGYLGSIASRWRRLTAKRTDNRVKLMSQIISGMKVIKMFAWELPFEKLIKVLRAKEISVVSKSSYLRGFYLSNMVFLERLTLYLTLVCYTLLGNNINAGIVFSVAQFLNILQLVTAIMYPMAVSVGAETLVSIKRIEEFLLLEEKEESPISLVEYEGIEVKTAVAYWVPENTILKKISFTVPKGCLCAVIGPVGAGKSSLLQMLLGELTLTSGSVRTGGTISYASQEPWLFASSIRNNILFGKDYCKELYKKVTKACALAKDFEQLPYGDQTFVGERGVSLSGGQKARINLARAIYRQADVYLLDDPLSSVDTHVGKHLFEKCIVKHLKGKTRILVTHQLQYLKKVDLIIVLYEGTIEALGSFKQLAKSNLDFIKFLTIAEEVVDDNEVEMTKESTGNLETSREQNGQEGKQEKTEEFQFPGESPLWSYIKSVNSTCTITSLIAVLVIAQIGCSACDLWSAFWSNQEEMRRLEGTQNQLLDSSTSGANIISYSYASPASNATFLGFPYDSIFDQLNINYRLHSILKAHIAMSIYGLLVVLVILLTIARSILFFNASMKASKNIHSSMFHSLLQTPMRFFDENPSGRVLNRFSKDIGAIDEILPKALLEAVQIFLVMLSSLVAVTVSNYYMLLTILILGAVFMKMRSWYMASARDIKHLEGIAKSSVFSHITSSFRGLVTIRAFQADQELIHEFDEHQDVHTAAYNLTILCSEFFGLWLDIICVVFIAVVCFGLSVSAHLGYVTSGSMVGLAISQSLILTGMLQYGMKQSAETINQLTSVERVLQYTKLDNEGPFDTSKRKLPVLPWPSFGRIQFRNVSLSYTDEDGPVLKNLNFIIQSGKKIGVVGRTGAGKSSLISALFRLAPIQGQVLIDDLDTKNIGLTDLRKKISIIPQEPVLFSASLRFNLDPFEDFEDKQMWSALEEVELKEMIPTLDFQVAEEGVNFSLGERQLFCLARALLRNNKILVLDEATANVDAITDGLIQKTIRRKFKQCTVITIAHRLNTIMDSDKVLVMDRGHIVEYDHPHRLLQLPEGYFTRMVMETGPAMTAQLRIVAQNAWSEQDGEDVESSRF